jgi:hypothetical protein
MWFRCEEYILCLKYKLVTLRPANIFGFNKCLLIWILFVMDSISFYFCIKHEMLDIINKKKFLIEESGLTS